MKNSPCINSEEANVKKIFFISLTIFITLFTSQLNAQLQIGPKAGLNFANVVGDDAHFFGRNVEMRTAFSGGIYFMYQFSNLFAIQPEANYTMKGATLDVSDADITFSLNYIEVPLLLKLIIPVEGSDINPSIFAGPSISFNTTAKVTVEANGESMEEDLEDVESTDLSLVFGGGIGFMIDKNEIGFDVRYILGLSSLDDSPNPDDVKNTVIAINIYYGFSVQ